MLDCRYYDMCFATDDSCNGEQECPKRDHCQLYSPMPDVKALKGLADEMDVHAHAHDYEGVGCINAGCLWAYSDRIREALEGGES